MVKMLTWDEVETRIYDHLITQYGQSVNDNGACRYRGEKGLKCAIGALIPDDVYTPEMERYAGTAFRQHNILTAALLAEGIPCGPDHVEGAKLLEEWQAYHDDESNWDSVGRYIGPITC